jgi:hypothetical protein
MLLVVYIDSQAIIPELRSPPMLQVASTLALPATTDTKTLSAGGSAAGVSVLTVREYAEF